MKITKKRINSIEKYIAHAKEGDVLRILIKKDDHQSIISKLGVIEGQSTMLSSDNGKASEYNSEGREIKRKDLPMEDYQIEWPRELTDGNSILFLC